MQQQQQSKLSHSAIKCNEKIFVCTFFAATRAHMLLLQLFACTLRSDATVASTGATQILVLVVFAAFHVLFL